MARLNEPPMSMDSIETLRRKFLRQNRDIARVNSAQSLQIRSLQNECSRLLSENLDLRGQVLRLEKDAETNSAHRIADHALEIKARMEAQLAEWGALVAGLGLEPPRKRHSPERTRKSAQSTASPGRSSSPRRPPREPSRDLDAIAMQEGRLPPIYEHKPYPRQTLNRDEIVALCYDGEDSANSPDLGPPPVSRYMDEDPIKRDSPKMPAEHRVYSDARPIPISLEAPKQLTPPPPTAVPRKKQTPEPALGKEAASAPAPASTPVPAQSRTELVPAAVAVRPGSKRKYAVGDENAPVQAAPSNDSSKSAKSAVDKPGPFKDPNGKRNIKELAPGRRDARQKLLASGQGAGRQPLAAKSTNESPRKLTTVSKGAVTAVAALDGLKPIAATKEPKEVNVARDTHSKPPLAIQIPDAAPHAPPVEAVAEPDLPVAIVDSRPLSPDTPGRIASSRKDSCDTPPPMEITAGGDAGRAGRRSRPAISYAEPNLRDKMRRPSKQLFDAVAGEGKYKPRMSTSNHKDDAGDVAAVCSGAGSSTVVGLAGKGVEVLNLPTQSTPSATEPLQPLAASRHKRSSTTCARDSHVISAQPRHDDGVAEDVVVVKEEEPEPAVDPYEFTECSPAQTADDGAAATAGKGVSVSQRGGAARSSRRAHPSASVAADNEGAAAPHRNLARSAKSAPSSSSRKRASLAVPKKASMLDADETDDEYVDTSSSLRSGGSPAEAADQPSQLSARDRISRRRSMML